MLEIQEHAQKEDTLDFCTYSISQVKQFMSILYGSCVRFYSTVVEWEFLQQMKEDLIEKLTSMVFNDAEFSRIVLRLCTEINKESEIKLLHRLKKLVGLKPKHVGISPYLVLDSSGNIE